VGLDPQERFAIVDEDRYMEDPIGVQVEVLDTVIVEKTFEEVARRKSQPALHESGEHRDVIGVLLHWIRIPSGGTPHVHLLFPKETTVEQRQEILSWPWISSIPYLDSGAGEIPAALTLRRIQQPLRGISFFWRWSSCSLTGKASF
jgi:hypothetical protein